MSIIAGVMVSTSAGISNDANKRWKKEENGDDSCSEECWLMVSRESLSSRVFCVVLSVLILAVSFGVLSVAPNALVLLFGVLNTLFGVSLLVAGFWPNDKLVKIFDNMGATHWLFVPIHLLSKLISEVLWKIWFKNQ